ncbi:pyridoxine biosynthesis protein [Fusarium falciforme]|uniref:Pyridoxine biosynthesis protein n=1 Tax=Fusarium falciforme TaxID=195108 RepID=A0A9W8RH96_9HYPO|nr:pyridoxine biosynthesis protein [Fusarium falciforme]KAJ4200687.1 pyridoxine biosynthesis protein [Fusarium falciforme]KAJ4261989.1 pyridoxine biosynthesis protein [Fusarium falciforme]
MASLAAAYRASARVVATRSVVRTFTTSTRCLAAQNFTMPALSPTMTEGNIASWKVKEGESFSAGDVLLEIETDKATMDVEAQDDGVMVKIMTADGSKAVQVGSRIAVIAEAGDDISSLEIPADEQPKAQPSQATKETAPTESKPAEKKSAPKPTGTGTYEHKYPLLPSVGHLVKEKGLSEDDVRKIKGTGPHGRLLKGDVLAYLGAINPDTPAANESNFNALTHLDLSNIKVAEKKAPKEAPKEAAPTPKAPVIENLELSIPVSLSKVIEVQNKIQDTLGVFLPISTFVGRAAEVANDALPALKRAPTTDELFDQVLGLDKVKAVKGSRGVYLPQISAIPPASLLAPKPAARKQTDIIDILAAPGKKAAPKPATIRTVPGMSSGANLFTLVVPKAEEERAQIFLERCKVILEEEPGRLVL